MTITIEKIMPDIVQLLVSRPGLRTVQIADSLDVDFDLVEEALKRLSLNLSGGVYSSDVRAPNGRKALAWWPVSAGHKQRQATPSDNADKELLPPTQVTRPAAGTAIPSAAFPSVTMENEPAANAMTAQPTETPRESLARPGLLAIRAIAYLRHHPAASNDQMKRLLGISYAPTAALKTAREQCWLTYANQIWTLGPVEIELTATELMEAGKAGIDIDAVHAKQQPVKTIPAAAIPVHLAHPPLVVGDGSQKKNGIDTRGLLIIEILRMKLTSEEYKGFLKGNVVLHTLRAERVGQEEDYQQAAIYSGHLVDATTSKTA